jgi:hypothetical protein
MANVSPDELARRNFLPVTIGFIVVALLGLLLMQMV